MPASFNVNVTADQIYQEYQIAAGASASAAQLLAFSTDPLTGRPVQHQKALITARGDNIVLALGSTSAVAASKTLTSNALPAGMFSVDAGAVFEIAITPGAQSYLSCIAQGAGGTLVVRLVRAVE